VIHTRRVVIVATGLLALAVAGRMASAGQRTSTVAVFPVENLSGGGIPGEVVRQFLMDRLASAGFRVLGPDALDDFMVRHRVRYAAGIDAETAGSLRQETGVEAVLVASVELSSTVVPPKIALTARLISTQATPAVIWADDAGMAGNEAPGVLELGLVNDYETLLTRALERLTRSLLAYLGTGEARTDVKSASKFRPRMFYRGLDLEPGRTYSVAVLPFFNLSERRNASGILALLFMRHMSGFQQFRVIDTGVVRRQLLNARIIMEGGLSIRDAELVGTLIDADFLLAGRVIYYQDYDGPEGRTRVEFSTVLIEKSSRRVVWSSDSYNDGTDGVHFFGLGTSRTAHAMATQMVRRTAEMIVGSDN